MEVTANLSTMSSFSWGVIGVLGLAVCYLIYYMVRHKVSIGSIGLDYKTNYSKVWAKNRDIDDKYRIRNKELIKSYKERFFSVFVSDFGISKTLSALAAEKILTPIEESVDRNHYSHIFTSLLSFKTWEQTILDTMFEEVKLMRVYYSYEERVDWDRLSEFFRKILQEIKSVLVRNTIDSCIEKIHLYDDGYAESKDELWKQLKEKNQGYIDKINTILGNEQL